MGPGEGMMIISVRRGLRGRRHDDSLMNEVSMPSDEKGVGGVGMTDRCEPTFRIGGGTQIFAVR